MNYSVTDLPWLPSAPDDVRSLHRALDLSDPSIGNGIQKLANYNLKPADATGLGKVIARALAAGNELIPLSRYSLGVLSNATTDFIIDALPAAAARHGVAASAIAAPYDQILQQALDPGSALHRAKPDAVLLAVDHRWLGFDSLNLGKDVTAQIDLAIARFAEVVNALRQVGGLTAILQTIPAPPLPLFGSFDRRMPASPRALIDEVNRRLVTLAAESGNYLLDVAALAEGVGTDTWFDPVVWHSYKLPFASRCVPIYADLVGRLLGAIRGKAKKCLVLDLDNTVWGGVIGDDGIDHIVLGSGSALGEAFLAVQRMALNLRERGIMLAVSSRNEDATARAPFKEHPEMLLRDEHISVFQANWLDKASNIEAIAKELNIGVDAMVLLDDNPAERAYVRAALPMVGVPELPSDASWYPWFLSAAGYFEAIGFTVEDRLRVETYAADARRAAVMARSHDLGDYLRSLEMTINLAPFDQRSRQRIAQLINKSNQFNLTTRRYTEAEVAAAEADPSVFTLQARLRDRFGDLGMIAVVICRPSICDGEPAWMIDSWLMSCRVLGRQVEMAMLSEIVAAAKQHGVRHLLGLYRPTAKNAMVNDHYAKLGFETLEISSTGDRHYRLHTTDFGPPVLPMAFERASVSLEPAIP